jgi:hypothetical protein
MKVKLLLLILFIELSAFGQTQNSIWVFGDSAGIDFSNVSNPIPIVSGMGGRGSCASISDSAGNLIMYCYNKTGVSDYSTSVYNYTNDTVTNGNLLNGEGLYNQITIIPKPLDSAKYYIFHVGIFGTQGFYYSLVDMTLNGGLGEVTQKNIPLINNTRIADCARAIKHGNGRDWWVVAKLSSSPLTNYNRFFVFLVSPFGISPSLTQSFGNATDQDFQKFIFNSGGSKLMLINTKGLMTEYDFDRCTGIISNPNIIYPEQSTNFNRFFWEGEYSHNDTFFYTTTTWSSFPNDTSRLLQFNLLAADIPSSCDTLFEARNPYLFGAVRLAPDKKIYMTTFYNWGFPGYPYPDSVYNPTNMNLSVINYPDSIGATCDFQPFSFYLGGKRTYAGLPNNPNYSLGPLSASSCDSLTVAITLPTSNSSELFVFYHTGWQKLFVNAHYIKGKNSLLKVFDINGKEVYSSSKNTNPPYFTQDVDVSKLTNGVYIVAMQTEKERLVKRFVKE